jgi:hypothetical protein
MAMIEAWNRFRPDMEGRPFLVSALVDSVAYAKTLIDSGCLSYGLCDSRFARRHDLQRIKIEPREMEGFNKAIETVDEIVGITMDIDGHRQEKAFLYVVPRLSGYDMILGNQWILLEDVRVSPRED